MRSWFTWGEFDSRAMGVLLDGETPIQRGQERVTEITIPGRAGELTLLEGEGIYKSYVQKLTVKVKGAEQAAQLMRILSGTQRVTFSTEPDKWQWGRTINPISLARISRGLDWYEGVWQIKCDPYKRLLSENTLPLDAAQTVHNRGDAPELAQYILRGSGTLIISVDGNALTITEVSGGCIVDCETQTVTNLDGTELITRRSTGDFPIVPKGFHTLTLSGAASAIMLRKERFI